MPKECNWRIWCPQMDETSLDANTILADGAYAAVEKWAEENDSNSAEYDIAKGKPVVVYVMYEDGGIRKFGVVGEFQPVYYVTLCEEQG